MLSAQEVIGNFELLEDWDSRYAYLVELGERLSPMDGRCRTEACRVQGCMSNVWVCARPDPSDSDRLLYEGDCDTAIIKGVLAILIGLLSGRTREEIEAFDVDQFFDDLNIAQHLSPNRHFGIYAIVELMKAQARQGGAETPAN